VCISQSIPNRTIFILLLAIPGILTAFTHLWNPIGFPNGPSNDEGIYIRRAMHVLIGQGPQESSLYDHPYFSQLLLTGVLSLIGYPNSLHPSVGDVHSIEMLYLVPRILMALLAIADTFLIYTISEIRYSRSVAFIASILFAVMPITTWFLRRVWLEPIQLPFILTSILFAVFYTKNSIGKNKNKKGFPYSWIPLDVFHLNHNYYVDYYNDIIPVKTKKVLLTVDPPLIDRLSHNQAANPIQKIYNSNNTKRIAIFGQVSIYLYDKSITVLNNK
jgi:hypothetical protein